jgi:hypothetical protein
MKLHWLVILPLLVGCNETDYRDTVACEMALATMTETDAPEVCECGGDGVITHGDGHETPCPVCNTTQYGGIIGNVSGAAGEVERLGKKVNAILDDATRQGYINIQVQIPGQEPRTPMTRDQKPSILPTRSACASGSCPPPARLFPRLFRRAGR